MIFYSHEIGIARLFSENSYIRRVEGLLAYRHLAHPHKSEALPLQSLVSTQLEEKLVLMQITQLSRVAKSKD
jgi:hypothetical protein